MEIGVASSLFQGLRGFEVSVDGSSFGRFGDVSFSHVVANNF